MSDFKERFLKEVCDVGGAIAICFSVGAVIAGLFFMVFLFTLHDHRLERLRYESCVADGGRPELCLMALKEKKGD